MTPRSPWVHAIQRLDLWADYLAWFSAQAEAGLDIPQENARDWLTHELDRQDEERRVSA